MRFIEKTQKNGNAFLAFFSKLFFFDGFIKFPACFLEKMQKFKKKRQKTHLRFFLDKKKKLHP